MIRDGEVRYHDSLGPFLEPIDAVTPHPRNDNNGDLDAIDESIHINGMYRAIYAQRSTGHILAGNHTWETLAAKGAQQVPVVWLDVDDTEALRILLSDNRVARLAIPDHAKTVHLLTQLATSDHGLAGTGYHDEDLTVLQTLVQMPLQTDEYAQWPTLVFTVHPKTRAAFRRITKEADTDPEKFELLLRLAGWDGS